MPDWLEDFEDKRRINCLYRQRADHGIDVILQCALPLRAVDDTSPRPLMRPRVCFGTLRERHLLGCICRSRRALGLLGREWVYSFSAQPSRLRRQLACTFQSDCISATEPQMPPLSIEHVPEDPALRTGSDL